jgi:hypothetical protein
VSDNKLEKKRQNGKEFRNLLQANVHAACSNQQRGRIWTIN